MVDGSFLSDEKVPVFIYVQLQEGAYQIMSNKPKPKVQLVGQDGNVFNLLGICTGALKRAGQYDEAQELQSKVFASNSYNEALALMLEYVDDIGGDDDNDEDDDE